MGPPPVGFNSEAGRTMQIKFLEVRAHGLSRETFARMGMTASDPLSLASSQDS